MEGSQADSVLSALSTPPMLYVKSIFDSLVGRWKMWVGCYIFLRTSSFPFTLVNYMAMLQRVIPLLYLNMPSNPCK